MNKWESVKLGEVCRIDNGYAFKSKNYVSENGARVIRITNVQKGKIVDADPKFYPFDKLENLERFEIFENDIMMTLTGNVGRVGRFPKEMLPAYINQRICRMTSIDSRLDEVYLFNLLNSDKFEKEAIYEANGAAQKNLSTNWIANYEIPLPPLSIQQEIAERLDKMATLIEKSKAQLSHYDALAESLFIELFGDPITNEKGWQKKKLGEVCEKIGDGLHGTPIYDDTGEYYFINGNNINNKKIKITEKTKRVGYSEYIKNKKNLNANTVFVSINGTLGNVGFYNDEKIILGKSICYLNIKTDIINKDYIHSFLDSDYFKKYANRVATGSTIKNVSLKSMRNLEIPLPPLSLQIKFAEQVENIEEQKTKIRAEIEQAEQGFQALLQESF